MTDTTTMGVKLDQKTRARLKALGKMRDRTPHYLMRTAIAEFLDREEAREAERQLLLTRWANYQRTGESVDGNAAEAWLEGLARGDVAPWPRGD